MAKSKTVFTVSDYILTRLAQLGIKHIFAVPGDYASPFLDALDAFDGITRISNINELGSGYAADAYGRLNGIGATCVQYGVGTFSVLNATAGSFVERIPVVVITGSPSASNRQVTRQEGVLFHHSTGDLSADQYVFEEVTVAAEIIGSAKDAPAQIDHALTLAITHHRPIYLEVWKNVWTLKCAKPRGTLKPVPFKSEVASLDAAINSAWERIRSAKHPLIWAGVEIQRLGLQDLLQEMVNYSGMPFTTTSLGKTVLDESQPQFIGTYAGPASLPSTSKIVADADCILTLGAIITDDYLDIMADDYDKMILSTMDEMRVGYQFFQEVAIKDFMTGLLKKMKQASDYPVPISIPKPTSQLMRIKDSDQLTYNRFYHVLDVFLSRNKLKDKVELILGESTSLYVFGNMMGLGQNTFLANAAWGSLGHETGAALGVSMSTNRRPMVVAGDGGFMMVCQCLSTLSKYNIDAIVFVMSNKVYAIEQAFVDTAAFTPSGSFAPYDELPQWNYKALAKGFGVAGYSIHTVRQLRTLLRRLQKQKGPALVEVVIPQKDFAPQLKRLAETP